MPTLVIEKRTVKLFRNGANQALRIPREFELPGDSAILKKEGDRLIIEPTQRDGLLALIESWDPITDEFPDTDGDLLPLTEVQL
jgi:antitoxin VapB